MDKNTSDKLWTAAGIGVIVYGFTKIPFVLRFIVCCGLAIIIMMPIDWCYSAVTGERIFWPDAPPAFSNAEEHWAKHWETWAIATMPKLNPDSYSYDWCKEAIETNDNLEISLWCESLHDDVIDDSGEIKKSARIK